MGGLLIAVGCLTLSAGIICLLNWWIGGAPTKFHDLTRPSEFLDQVTREPNNTLSAGHYEIRRDALGHGAVREVKDGEL